MALFQHHRLRKGELIKLSIQDVIDAQNFIVSCNGLLLRVKNASMRPLVVGETIQLQVLEENPLRLGLPSRGPGSFARLA